METVQPKNPGVVSIVLFIIGSLAMILGMFLTLTIWLSIIGIPILAVGFALVWMTRFSVKVKLLATLVPSGLMVLTYVGIIAYAIYFKSDTIPVTYLVPAGFVGKVAIVYDQACGEKREIKDGVHIYKIPKSGILLVKDERENEDHQLVVRTYYQVDQNGVRGREIFEHYSAQDQLHTDDSVKINSEKHIRTLEAIQKMSTVVQSDEDGHAIAFSSFAIMPWDSLENDVPMDSLILKVVKECNAKK